MFEPVFHKDYTEEEIAKIVKILFKKKALLMVMDKDLDKFVLVADNKTKRSMEEAEAIADVLNKIYYP